MNNYYDCSQEKKKEVVKDVNKTIDIGSVVVKPKKKPFLYCLRTDTINPYSHPIALFIQDETVLEDGQVFIKYSYSVYENATESTRVSDIYVDVNCSIAEKIAISHEKNYFDKKAKNIN